MALNTQNPFYWILQFGLLHPAEIALWGASSAGPEQHEGV